MNRMNIARFLADNFDEGGVLLTATYNPKGNDYPSSIYDIKRHKTNFVTSIKKTLKRLGEDPAELKSLWCATSKFIQKDMMSCEYPKSQRYILYVVLSHPAIKRRLLTCESVANHWEYGLTMCYPIQPDKIELYTFGRYLAQAHEDHMYGSHGLRKGENNNVDRDE